MSQKPIAIFRRPTANPVTRTSKPISGLPIPGRGPTTVIVGNSPNQNAVYHNATNLNETRQTAQPQTFVGSVGSAILGLFA